MNNVIEIVESYFVFGFVAGIFSILIFLGICCYISDKKNKEKNKPDTKKEEKSKGVKRVSKTKHDKSGDIFRNRIVNSGKYRRNNLHNKREEKNENENEELVYKLQIMRTILGLSETEKDALDEAATKLSKRGK